MSKLKTNAKGSENRKVYISLKRLMDLGPCHDGLAEVLLLFKKKKMVRGATNAFWQQVRLLERVSNYDELAKPVRRELRKMQGNITIEVKPKVFADQIVTAALDGEFYTFVLKLLSYKGLKDWKRRSYEKLKDELDEILQSRINDDIRRQKEMIEHYTKCLADANKRLGELTNAEHDKHDTKSWRLAKLDPDQLIIAGWDHRSSANKKRIATVAANELAIALRHQLQGIDQ